MVGKARFACFRSCVGCLWLLHVAVRHTRKFGSQLGLAGLMEEVNERRERGPSSLVGDRKW